MNNERPLSDKITENRDEKQIHTGPQTQSTEPPRGFFEINEQMPRSTAPSAGRDFAQPIRFKNNIEEPQGYGMSGLWAALIGVGAGMAAMYFLDPTRGGRRRAVASDKLISGGNLLPGAVRVTATDL